MKAPVTILMADDDEDDRLLAKDAFIESRIQNKFLSVEDGVELLDYLHRRNGFADLKTFPTPSLILLDLNMPRMDGREALAEIKSDPVLRRIPVIVFTTSSALEDVEKSYDLGAASFISKPETFASLVDFMKSLGGFWAEFVQFSDHTPAREIRS